MSGIVTIFEDKNFKGKQLTLDLSTIQEGILHPINLSSLNNKMSSVKWDLPSNVRIQLYEYSDGTGHTYTQDKGTGSDPDIQNTLNDSASAYRWFKVDPEFPTEHFADIPAVLVTQLFDGLLLPKIFGTKIFYTRPTQLVRITHRILRVNFFLKADAPTWDPKVWITAEVKISVKDSEILVEIIDVRYKADSSWLHEVLTLGLIEIADNIAESKLANQLNKLNELSDSFDGIPSDGIPSLRDIHFLDGGTIRLFFDDPKVPLAVIVEGIPRIQESIGGSIWLFGDNGCSGSIKGALTDIKGRKINFKNPKAIISEEEKDISGFPNDEARSVRLVNVRPDAKILVFDNPDGSKNDDYLEIEVKRRVKSYCISTLERSFENEDLKVVYHRDNGLDGKASRIEVY